MHNRSMASAAPIFLHSGFRSGSTWFWNRFREADGTFAFYEPLHESKALMTAESIAADRADNTLWTSGHPPLHHPYNVEYLEMLGPDGVQYYKERFAYDTYYTAEDDDLRRYIGALSGHAQGLGKTAVLGFKRSMGRVASLKRHHRGVHIVTLRDPWDQWASMANQIAAGNHYFGLRVCLIAAIGRHASAYGDIFDGLIVPKPIGDTGEQKLSFLRLFYRVMSPMTVFRLFLRVFLLDALLALPEADVSVDLDRLSAEVGYREAMTARLRDVTGLADLQLDDCRLPRHSLPADPAYGTAFEEILTLLDRHRLAPDRETAIIRDKLELSLSRFVPLSQPVEQDSSAWDPLSVRLVLFAVRMVEENGGNVDGAVRFLEEAWGGSFATWRAHLADIARFVIWSDSPLIRAYRTAADRLYRALAET